MANNFVDTWVNIVTHPNDFFRNMPVSDGYGYPLVFAVINYIIIAIITTVRTLIQTESLAESENMLKFMVGMQDGMFFFNLIKDPVFGVIGLFISAAILFVCFKIVGGSGTYDGTFWILAYTSVTEVFSALLGVIIVLIIPSPTIGSMMVAADIAALPQNAVYSFILMSTVTVYSIFLQGVGGKYIHDISMLRSVTAVLLPFIAIGVLSAFVILMNTI